MGIRVCLVISILIIFSPEAIRAQDRGVIYIGNSNTDLATEFLYPFTEKDNSQAIPIFSDIISASDPSQTVARTGDITVFCYYVNDEETGLGFTTLTFANLTLLSTEDAGVISITPTETGRAVSVQCAAESNSESCPISAGGAQFCPTTSLSNVVSIRLQRSATVTLCELKVDVIEDTSTFNVRLSEPAQSEVTVTCRIDHSDPALSTTTSISLNTGSTEGQVNLDTTSWADDSFAQVTCTAQSVTGSQFTTAGSEVAESTGIFTKRANSISFQPAALTVLNTTIVSFLTLRDGLDSQTVGVACRASTYTTLASAFTAAAADPNCAVIDSVSSGTTTPWRVQNAFFDLTPSSSGEEGYFERVIVGRVQQVTQSRIEVVVTQCCVRDVTGNNRLVGLTATMVAVADLAPFICEQCNTTVEDPKLERVIQNPGYVDLSPCPCDLTQNACNFNCCCDMDCSEAQQGRFNSCLPGLPGGQSADPEEYRCSSDAFNLPDWHVLTCVWEESNAYLGMYYMNQDKVSETDFSSVVAAEYKGRFSFSDAETTTVTTSFKHGVSVTTIREDVASADPTKRGILALPRPDGGTGGAGGYCNRLSPAKYLVDTEASCTELLTVDTCSDLSGFSARIYAVSSDIAGCSQSFKVTSTYGGDIIAPTDVRYYCATDISPYQPSTQETTLDQLSGTQVSSFDELLLAENCSSPCSNPVCINYNVGRESAARPALPSPCSWDDGSTAPPVPSFASGTTTCQNVVLDVRYRFEWSGGQIARLSADVILGDVPGVAQGLEVAVTQKFETEWIYQTNGSTYVLSDNYGGGSEAYARSGSAGYDPGFPLESGCAQYDDTTAEFQTVNTALERQMAIWRPGVDGLCVNATRQSVNFGEDVLSSCALRLTADDLESGCDDLRQTVFNHLNVLMPADVLGRYGYNNPQDLTMWIPVTRQVLNETEDSSVANAADAINNDTERSWAEAITGRCNLPTSVNLNVMYTKTGEVNGYPRLEVVGAYISYTESTWSMDCQGGLASRCQPGPTNTLIAQNFFLSSSVQFIQVDTTTQDSKTRFHTKCDPYDFSSSDSCERFFSHVYRDECYWEICWQELFYPIRPAADRGPDADWRLRALPAFLVMVLGIVGYVSVARPGWS